MSPDTFAAFYHEVDTPVMIFLGIVALRAIYRSIKHKDFVHAAAFVPVLAAAIYILYFA